VRWVLAIAMVLLLAPGVADAHPCDPPVPKQAPSAQLLGTLCVLRAPSGPDDLPPKDLLDTDGRPYATAMRWVPLAIGGGVWIVPLYDISDRVAPSEACIRSLPRRVRREVRRLKRASRGIPRLEGLSLFPYDAEGESHGQATGGLGALAEGAFVHADGTDGARATRVVGLAPDGVASVRVTIAARRDERRRPRARVRATVPVAENVFGVDLRTPFDFTTPEPEVVWLDASGAVVRPKS